MAKDYKCLDACFGLYADVTFINSTEKKKLQEAQDFLDLQKEYDAHKNDFLENLRFDPSSKDYGNFWSGQGTTLAEKNLLSFFWQTPLCFC